MTPAPPTRRCVLLAGGGALLAGCSSGGSGAPRPDGGSSSSGALAQLGDVPVGGAVAAQDAGGHPVVVAQPTTGTAVAHSAACTHQGCTVAVAGARLECPCHGSVFDALTGAVLQGPARRPLPAVAVHVQDGAVLAGRA